MSGFFFFEFLIATAVSENTARIHGGRNYALYQAHIIRIHKINLSCSWYKSWDMLMFIANCSAFHHQSINQSMYLTWSVRLAKKLVCRYATKEKEKRNYKSLLKVYKYK